MAVVGLLMVLVLAVVVAVALNRAADRHNKAAQALKFAEWQLAELRRTFR